MGYVIRLQKSSKTSLPWKTLANPLDQSNPKKVGKDTPRNLDSVLFLRNIFSSSILFFYLEEYQTHLFAKFEVCRLNSIHRGLGGSQPIILDIISTLERIPCQTRHKKVENLWNTLKWRKDSNFSYHDV